MQFSTRLKKIDLFSNDYTTKSNETYKTDRPENRKVDRMIFTQKLVETISKKMFWKWGLYGMIVKQSIMNPL